MLIIINSLIKNEHLEKEYEALDRSKEQDI